MRETVKITLPSFLLLLLLSISLNAQVPLTSTPIWESTELNQNSTGMVWRDVNNDGFIDLFVSNGNDITLSPNRVYINNRGTIPFFSSWSSADAQYSGHCAVGDINDDGYVDFAVANFIGSGGFSTKNLSVLYENNAGWLNTSPDWENSDSIKSFSCAFGDVDLDGDLDLAFATGDGYTPDAQFERIYYNIDGELQTTPGWQSSIATEALDITWGDVDKNGYLDLAIAADDLGAAVYFNYTGVPETSPSFQSFDDDAANTIIFGDVDGDGWLDLIVAHNDQTGGSGHYRVHYNDGAGNLNPLQEWQSATGGYGSAIALYDFDNDGDDDLAAGRWWDRPRIYENIGDTFTAAPIWQTGVSTVVEELCWVDVDGDGVEFRTDTIYSSDGTKLFYTSYHPLQSLDSVLVDGTMLGYADYCFDPISGWVTVGTAPLDSIVVYYQYSFKNDLALSNWDTYNMVYGNTRAPYVDFTSNLFTGWAPLYVQFYDNSVDASNWQWDFNDGEFDDIQNPVHLFDDGGAYDVYLELDLPDGPHNRIQRKMIIALADTIYFGEMYYPTEDTIVIPVYLRNTHPMDRFILPLIHDGDVTLTYLSHCTEGCRTEYYDSISLTNINPWGNQLSFTFLPSLTDPSVPPLEPGDGKILDIYFSRTSGNGVNVVDTTTISNKTLFYDAGYVDYQPYVIPSNIVIDEFAVGDVTLDGIINLSDILFLISYVYIDGPPPIFVLGDFTPDDIINLTDILDMITHVYGV